MAKNKNKKPNPETWYFRFNTWLKRNKWLIATAIFAYLFIVGFSIIFYRPIAGFYYTYFKDVSVDGTQLVSFNDASVEGGVRKSSSRDDDDEEEKDDLENQQDQKEDDKDSDPDGIGGNRDNGSTPNDEPQSDDGLVIALNLDDMTEASTTTPSPTLHMKLDEPDLPEDELLFEDSIGNNPDGTCTLGNCPAYDAAGVSGASRLFDGSGDYIKVTNNSGLPGSDEGTASLWVKSDDPIAGESILARAGRNLWSELDWVFSIGHNKTSSIIIDPANGLSSQRNALTIGSWHHVAATWNKLDTNQTRVQFFVDGTKSNETIFDGEFGESWNLNIGRRGDSYIGRPTNNFKGWIDEVKLFDEELNLAQIRTLTYDAAITVRTYADSSGNKLDAYCAEPTCPSVNSNGVSENARSFDGVDDSMLIPNDPAMPGSDAGSISIWVNPADLTYPETLIGRANREVWGETDWRLYAGQRSNLTWMVSSEDNLIIDEISSARNSVPDDEWTHVIATWEKVGGNTTRIALYIDGQKQIEKYSLLTVGANHNINLARAGYPNINPAATFEGSLDEVQIFNRALSEDEAAQMYAKANISQAPIIKVVESYFSDISAQAPEIEWLEKLRSQLLAVLTGGLTKVLAGVFGSLLAVRVIFRV
ncbi:LamG domain-containing protein [Patescibacteria group bacterium]